MRGGRRGFSLALRERERGGMAALSLSRVYIYAGMVTRRGLSRLKYAV